MSQERAIRRVAIVGTGTIGASWATHYLVRGLDVIATDPAPGAASALRGYVESAWADASVLGLEPDASPARLSFVSDLRGALAEADFVQESAPEHLDLKQQLFADMDAATPPEVIIASSSSGLVMTEIQAACRHPERTLVGHPMNPPHLMPLVEVVGGAATSSLAIATALSFYASIGKRPVHLRKELPGHAVNRIQSALYREVVYLIEQGVVSVADADDLVSWGPGLRWGVMGPSLLWHLAGGNRGIQSFAQHLMDPLFASWPGLGNPELTDELRQRIIDGVLGEVGGQSIEELTTRRDAMLLALQIIRTKDARPLQCEL